MSGIECALTPTADGCRTLLCAAHDLQTLHEIVLHTSTDIDTTNTNDLDRTRCHSELHPA
jgi:hypothetical protein